MLKVLSGTLKEANKKQKVSEALSPEEKLVSYWDSRYPRVGTQISGLTILDDVPNASSIAASFYEYIILPGIRDVGDFEISSLGDLFYAADDFRRARQLAEEIRQSGVIKPLIVGIDGSGPHLIEGHHRLGALSLLGIRSFPALIAIDVDEIVENLLTEKNRAAKEKTMDSQIIGIQRPSKVSAILNTEQLPQVLAQAISYECGGRWEVNGVWKWTEEFDAITGKQLGEEEGYSTSFWVHCKDGDGYFHQKWGVQVNFTVTSGSSNTEFDSEIGDWDLTIDANVQRASPNSWTQYTPYALLVKSVGSRENMSTIQEVANFVKQAIWNDQSDNDNDDDDDDDFEPEPEPPYGVEQPVEQPAVIGKNWLQMSGNWFQKVAKPISHACLSFGR